MTSLAASARLGTGGGLCVAGLCNPRSTMCVCTL